MAVSWQDVTDGSQSSRRHLFGPFWGVVERDPDGSRRLWTWSVEREGVADPVAEGFAYDAPDATEAVDEWARRHRPRGLRSRLAARLGGRPQRI